jgi:hypothetical protein
VFVPKKAGQHVTARPFERNEFRKDIMINASAADLRVPRLCQRRRRDALRAAAGFMPGGASLHNCMAPHGPDEEAFEKASHGNLKPQKLDNTLAFMFESRYRFIPTEFAMQSPALDPDYADCWAGPKEQYKS